MGFCKRLSLCLLLCGAVPASVGHSQYIYKWWDVVVSSPSDDGVYKGPALQQKQSQLIKKVGSLLDVVRYASSTSLKTCETVFSKRKWNCPRSPNPYPAGQDHAPAPYFGRFLDRGTREAGFVHALMSACLLFTMLQSSFEVPSDWQKFQSTTVRDDRSMRLHELVSDLKDSNRVRRDVSNLTNGGLERPSRHTCSPTSYNPCYSLSKYFTDLSDRTFPNDHARNRLVLMNRHNNEIGRQVVIHRGPKTKCQCSGVSGSCSAKTCYKTMKQFISIARILRKRYLHSVQVETALDDITGDERLVTALSNSSLNQDDGEVLLTLAGVRRLPPAKSLVHLKDSPNFCEASAGYDLPGTLGRRCNHNQTMPGLGRCQKLCCGRGWRRQVVQESCNCKFKYCCRMECEICLTEEKRCN